MKKQKIDNLSLLRKKAEAKLKKQDKTLKNLSSQSVRELAHELGTHQIELEMQNEELRRARNELEESHTRYVDLYDFAPVGYFTLDKDGLIVEVNLTGAEMLGMNRRFLLKKTFGSFLAGQTDRDIFHLHRREVLQTQTRQTCEAMIRKKDAPSFAAQIISMPIKAIAGHSRMSLIDISQRRLAEGLRSAHDEIERDAARIVNRSERKYRELFENMINGFAFHKIITDKQGRPVDYEFQEVNHAFEKLTGLQSADILGKRVTEVLPGIEHDPANWIGKYGEVALTGKEIRFEQYAKPLGKWFSVSAYCPMPGYFAAIFEDITERKKSEKEIEHLASFPRLNPSPVIEMDPQGNITFLNAATRNILASLGIPDGAALFLPDNARDIWQATSDGGDARTLHREVEIKNRVFAENIYVSKDLGVIRIYATDITERKRAEKEREHLLAQVQRQAIELDAVFKALPYLVSVHAMDGRYLRVNPAIVKLFGLDPTNATREEIARKVKAHFPDGRPLTPENMPSSRALKGEAVHGVEYQITNEQGETHDLLMNAIPLQVAGRVYGIVIAQMDITERKRVEEELSKSTELLQAVISGTDDSIFVKDLDSRLLLANPATLRIIGKNAEEVFGRTDAEIYADPEIGRTILETDRRIMDSGKTEIIEEIGEGPEGRRVFLSTKSPRFDAQGRVIGLIGISRDITKRKRAEEQLRELTQQLAYHVDNSPLAVIEWGPDMRLTRWSGAAEHVFGWKAEEVLGKRMEDFRWIYQEDEPQVEEVSADLRTGASPRRFSANRNYRKDGSVIHCEWYNSSLVDQSGSLRSILSLVLDVTERKRAEEALEKMKYILSEGQRIAHVGTFEYVADTKTTVWSEEEYRIYGLDPAGPSPAYDVMLAKCIHPDDAALLHQTFGDAMQNGTVYDLVHRIVRPEGSVRWVHDIANPHFDRNGRLVRYIGATLDITERVTAEKKLRESEALYRSIGESIDYGVWVCDPEGRNTYASESFLKMVGITQEQCSNFGWGEVLHPDDSERTIAAWKECVRTGGKWDIEHRFHGVDGQWHHVLARGMPVRNEQGEVIAWAGINLDIGKLKQAEQALAKKTSELEDLNKNLEMRVEEELVARRKNEHMLIQQSKLAAMGEMISAIAHQWRQPLNVVGLIVQNMQEAFEQGRLDPDHMDRSVRKTMAQIEHMSRTIDDFRSFIIPDKEKRAFDAMRAVGNVLSLLSTQLSGDRITCRLTCHSHGETLTDPKDIVECAEKTIDGYQNEFEHVVFNLVNNARDAILEKRRSDSGNSSEPGLLSFDFYNRDGRVIVEISDNGGGIPAAVMDRIFEPYFSTKDMAKGTGIGLYMSKVIVEDHLNGTLTAKNHEGGAQFTISLPQAWTKGSS